MIFSWGLGGIIFLYTVVYTIKRGSQIFRFSQCNKNGEIKTFEGHIVEKIDEEKKAMKGLMVDVCWPKIEYIVEGKTRYYQSTIRYINACLNDVVEIGFCERTEEAWVIKDIPLMKKNLIVKVITMMAILTMLVVTEVIV